MSNPTTEIVRKLVAIRRGSGLTQQHVADRMHVSRPAVSQFEARAAAGRYNPHLGTVVDYCRAIGVRLTYQVVEERR